MADTPERPLSPHLQIYRPQITSVLSITHRATGIVLSLGAVLLVVWLVSAASGPEAFDVAQACAGSWLGYIFLFGFSVCLFYHLLNGIRHLFWDTGHGLRAGDRDAHRLGGGDRRRRPDRASPGSSG